MNKSHTASAPFPAPTREQAPLPAGSTVPEHPGTLSHGWSGGWSREACPRGSGLPPGGAGGAAVSPAVGTAGSSRLAGGRGRYCHLQQTLPGWDPSPLSWRASWPVLTRPTTPCCRLWGFFSLPPCSHDLLLGAGRCKWEPDIHGCSAGLDISGLGVEMPSFTLDRAS